MKQENTHTYIYVYINPLHEQEDLKRFAVSVLILIPCKWISLHVFAYMHVSAYAYIEYLHMKVV